jgi:sulfide:quinone oxidoreductase
VAAGFRPAATVSYALEEFVPDGVRWLRDEPVAIDVDRKAVRTKAGHGTAFDLVVFAVEPIADPAAVGLTPSALAEPRIQCPALGPAAAWRTAAALAAFADTGGHALFTLPAIALAPCAALDLALLLESRLAREGRRNAATIAVACAGPDLPVPGPAARALKALLEARGIPLLRHHSLTGIAGDGKAGFLTSAGSREMAFDLLVVEPPARAPALISALGGAEKVVPGDFNPETLCHRRHATVFGLGGATGLAGSGTVAAGRAQVSVLARNLAAIVAGKPPPAAYDGYSVAPVFTRGDRAILVETDRSGRLIDGLPGIVRPLEESWIGFQLAEYALEGAWRATAEGIGLDGLLWKLDGG